jgi:hypothetical protein
MIFGIDPSMEKTVFLGYRHFAFSKSSLLAIAFAIDPIDPSIDPLFSITFQERSGWVEDFLGAQFVFAFFAQLGKNVFLGLNQFAFCQSGLLAIDQNCAKFV